MKVNGWGVYQSSRTYFSQQLKLGTYGWFTVDDSYAIGEYLPLRYVIHYDRRTTKVVGTW